MLDTFLRSASSLIACERSGRICYGMKLESVYVDMAIRRWESFTGERATKESRCQSKRSEHYGDVVTVAALPTMQEK